MKKINISKNILLVILAFMAVSLYAAPSAQLWSYWDKLDQSSTAKIDFKPWQNFLDKYVVQKGDQTFVNYAEVSEKDKENIAKMIDNYAKIDILKYNKNQQLAYWINMYNMLTIQVILQHYPVKSITDIDKGWFGNSKVWDQRVVKINGKELTLNDIEHRIIRPIWHDPRVHSAVNCASISCPNLSKEAYQGNQINAQLNKSFTTWINSSKGFEIKDNNIYISKIFDWYGSDFRDPTEMRQFVAKYLTNKTKKEAILNDNKTIYYQSYNWNLNQLPN
ncbi:MULTISPECIES: DUF547 domain-containing protein [unclassified Francisella]|uniref:DUF547 domain-containing protein n=1 Tax=unclassified Francisella TaxID=2610885 RepID=UPI002E30DEEF|nr:MULTISPECIES: DUF547 domain-containing protein [unclassified Francisella]MED7820349.1 DUF547 domain-containing protein [Francisella sp. 19S2-4]MED7831187.1 DUF547 domain-containing protein [Francisella sp. 19S2-10]